MIIQNDREEVPKWLGGDGLAGQRTKWTGGTKAARGGETFVNIFWGFSYL